MTADFATARNCLASPNTQEVAVFHQETGPPLSVPSIITDIDADPKTFSHLAFCWQYSARGVVRWKNGHVRSTQWVEGSLEDIPKSTVNYTQYLILKLFHSGRLANERFGHVTLENYKTTTKFILQCEPVKPYDDGNLPLKDIWEYRLAIEPKYEGRFGKRWFFERFLVSEAGHILYEGHSGTTGWNVRHSEKTPEGRLIEIIDDIRSVRKTKDGYYYKATLTRFLYQPGRTSLQKLDSKLVDVPKALVESFSFMG